MKKEHALLRCESCGAGFVPTAAVPADLEAIYSREYFEGKRSSGYPRYLSEAPMLERNFERRLAWIEAFRRPGRILDVGAAYGLFLRAACRRGWDPVGVEIAADCAVEAERLSGVPVLAGDFLAVDLEPGFDVITMFDVIEHMRDPIRCFERAWSLLAADGVLVVETGDLAAPWARLLGRYWYFLDPPQHLVYFTGSALSAAIRRCGFAGPVRRRRLGRRVSLANIGFKLALLAPPGLRRVMAPLRSLPGYVYLNFGDALLIAAAKR